MSRDRGRRVLRKPLLVGSLPVVIAAGGWLTNVLTSGWNPWLFGVLVAIVGITSVLAIAAERAAPAKPAIQPPPAPPVPDPPPGVWIDVPPRGRHFTGRGELLAALDRKPDDGHTTTVLVPHALHGLSGVGKTRLAIEYAHRNQDSYDLVAWIPAEQQALLHSSYRRIAAAMGIAESDDAELTVDRVRDGLRRGVPFRRWLVVFDNAEAPSALRRYLPESVPPHSTGRVIITSRDRTWSSVAEALEVEVLPRPESVALLRRRNLGMSAPDADRLADQLGDLPLALEQASAWLAASGTSVPDYLHLLTERTDELLKANRAADYPMSVAVTWGVALDRLSIDDPAAVQLLELAAFFGPEPIDRRLFSFAADSELPPETRDALTDPLRLHQAMANIGRLSLAKFDSDRGTIHIHRLVRAAVQARISPERQDSLRAAAQALLAAADASAPELTDPSTWTVHAMITPHLRPTDCLAGTDRRSRALVLHHLSYLFLRGDQRSRHQFAEEARDLWKERLGPDDEDTLMVTTWLATTTQVIGDTRHAETLLAEVLGRARRAHGNVHPVTLFAANSYGASLRIAGLYRDAYELDLRTLRDSHTTFGPSDPRTLQNASNLVVNLRMLGRFEEALVRDRENLKLHREQIESGRTGNFVVPLNCAIDLYHLGRYEECLTMLDFIPAAETQLGAVHVHVLLAYRTRVTALAARGRTGEAATIARPLLDRHRESFRPYFPPLLAMAMTTANVIRDEHPTEALRLARATLATHREADGGDHPATIAALINTAATERIAGERQAATGHDDEAADAAGRILGGDHWVTLAALAGQGVDRSLAGDHAAAGQLLRQAHDRATATRSAGHPDTLAFAVNLLKAGRRAAIPGDDLKAFRASTMEHLGQGRGSDAVLLRELRGRQWAERPVELPPY